MANVKNHHAKIVVFLFCLLQVQGLAKLLPEKIETPFDEFFREISQMANRTVEKVQKRLDESNIHVKECVEKIKGNVEITNDRFQELVGKFEEGLYENYVQMNEIIPKQINRVAEEIKARDPELAEKIKMLKTELIQLKEDLIKLYEDIKKSVLERYNDLRQEAITKIEPIVKRWTPVIKDVEEIISTLIPDKKKEYKKY